MKKPNKLIIKFVDNTHLDEYNESFELKKEWYGEEDDGQVLSIEQFYYRCREAAAAMGFAEGTINEWFGDF